ncbi:membrane protein required for colicin V production [Gammaproteobacteria bacterium]
MNLLDYAIFGFIVFSTLIGLYRGLVREILSIVALGASFWVAFVFNDDVAAMLQNYITLPSMRQVAAFAVLFFVMLLAMALLNYILVTVISLTDMSGTDRLLGMLFGVARGVVMIVVLVFLVGFTPFPKDPWWKDSQAIIQFQDMAHWSCQFLPLELHKLNVFCS